MKKITGLALMLVFFYFHAMGQRGNVTIRGQVINRSEKTPEVILVNFCNPFQVDYRRSSALGNDGTFSVENDMFFGQNLTVHYRETFINLFVTPGDHVTLLLDDAKYSSSDYSWVTVGGDKAEINNQLCRMANYIYGQKLKMNYDNSLSPTDFLQEVKDEYSRYLKIIDDYSKENNIDPFVKQWAECDIKYVIANYITDYGSDEENREKRWEKRKAVFFSDYFDINNPENFQTMYFDTHLGFCRGMLEDRDSIAGELKRESKYADYVKRSDIIFADIPAGYSRDYMIYSTLSGIVRKNPKALIGVEGRETYFNDPEIYACLKDEIEYFENPNFDAVEIGGISYLNHDGDLEMLPKIDFFTYLSNKYRNKAIYIDVYAAWCGPCRSEFQHAAALQKELDGKEVVFVNLCLESGYRDWLELLKQMPGEAEQFFLDDNASKMFMGSYGIGGFPSYILVDRKGNIVTNKAFRPSDKKQVSEQISSLL